MNYKEFQEVLKNYKPKKQLEFVMWGSHTFWEEVDKATLKLIKEKYNK